MSAYPAMDLNRHVPKGTYPAADFPEYPARVLLAHCVAKGMQWSVLGWAVWSLQREDEEQQQEEKDDALSLEAEVDVDDEVHAGPSLPSSFASHALPLPRCPGRGGCPGGSPRGQAPEQVPQRLGKQDRPATPLRE
jgi:hypothetical protein